MSCTDTPMARVFICAKALSKRYNGKVNAKQIALACNMTPAFARKALDELVTRGYVERILGGDFDRQVRYRPDITKLYVPKRRLKRHTELLVQDAMSTINTENVG